tara:strand:+ start:334 stop:1785 length:1452 start_codon:yes stop_codon:yes gene_type:complete
VLQFDIDVSAADTQTRTIEGVAVPYGETANLGGVVYRFQEGSLSQARNRTPLLLGHDRNRPIGVLVELADTPTGALARFQIDNGVEGDLALEQAASGSRGGLSIGADIITGEAGADGVVTVTEASLLEVSLVAIPAFAGADVTSVAADDETPTLDPDPAPHDETPTQEIEEMMETTPDQVTAELAPIIASTPARAELSADAYVQHMVRAMKGDATSARLIEAALDVADVAAVVGLVPDFYTRQIIGGLAENRSFANNVRRAAMPAEGMHLYKPVWGTTPVGGWITEADPTPTNAVTITNHEVDVLQWAYGISMTVAAMERGVGVAEAIYRQIILNYYADVEAKLALAITTAAGTPVVGGASVLATVGILSAEVYSDSGRRPDKAYMAPDVWAELLATDGSLPFTGGATNANTIAGQIAGLDIVVSSNLAAGTIVVADSNVIELRESNPLQLRANVVGTMQIELGVTSFVTTDVELASAVKLSE